MILSSVCLLKEFVMTPPCQKKFAVRQNWFLEWLEEWWLKARPSIWKILLIVESTKRSNIFRAEKMGKRQGKTDCPIWMLL